MTYGLIIHVINFIMQIPTFRGLLWLSPFQEHANRSIRSACQAPTTPRELQ